ncbi:Cys-tRNA(Pro) deacylase [Oceanobacillus alkalisoli]|uniref:Cys-tRNA(Pro) deacylase n=1 Tax=Oceanobacillus alkalisoli TaxID=2925113 RepID=UPI001EF063F1|nr:Cys-tRNA(Pro) deacylase [Oceanobacillus alkalisoli]MCF3943271.1 Cys-tRNA(Pro) deacylase [Oceanobacillus alkalisoli]MCG5103852.1 Cys-tRNA(Pro) deacylase [Oceanobacillus alkalisoli]
MKKTNVHRLLDKEKVAYQIHEYAWKEDSLDAETAASQTNIPLEKVFKTLVTVGDKTGPVVVVISAQDELNLKKLAKVSGNKKIDMLPMKDLEKTTGYIRGGCSPIGMKKSYPTYIDSEAKGLEYLVISAGKRGSQVELSPEDLRTMTEATYADLRAE